MRYSTPGTGRPALVAATEGMPAVGRRGFLKMAGGGALAAGAVVWGGAWLAPESATSAPGDPDLYFAGTDGWIALPRTPRIPPFHPDNLAPDPFTTYIFGFRNLSFPDQTPAERAQLRKNQKMKAQHSAPLFWVPQYDPANPKDFTVTLTNLGLELRPDLFDAHTLHWHGFRNVIPFFDGEPTGSISVRTGREFTYVYRPRDPGTYMFHCHVEDVEHVHMGMTGMVFVRPLQDGTEHTTEHGAFTRFMYNDGDGTTGFHREFSMFLSEVWAEAHWADAHIQLPEWTDYRPDFSLLNGRVYPDTIAPNGSIDPFHPVTDASGDLVPTPGHEHLQYQPISSLVPCNEGERVALRFANLGFREAAMTLTGIPMTVVGRDATYMHGEDGSGVRGPDGADTSYVTDTLNIGPGESYDVLFTAPPHSGGADPDTYLLYNRSYVRDANLAPGGYGGQTTEIRVYPAGTVAGQGGVPNEWGI